MIDPRIQHSPSAERNKDAILPELIRLLAGQASGSALEIAAGTGQHAAHFAAALPNWQWQPSDPNDAAVASIAGRVETAGLTNLLAPLQLDVTKAVDWPAGPFSLVYCANMIHISPWVATEGLLAGAARVLAPGGLLVTYGPYFQRGVDTAPSNLAFDESLKSRNPEWGIRTLEAVAALAAEHGFAAPSIMNMPANNLLLAFLRT